MGAGSSFSYCMIVQIPIPGKIGNLSNDDGDGNENGKKAIGLY